MLARRNAGPHRTIRPWWAPHRCFRSSSMAPVVAWRCSMANGYTGATHGRWYDGGLRRQARLFTFPVGNEFGRPLGVSPIVAPIPAREDRCPCCGPFPLCAFVNSLAWEMRMPRTCNTSVSAAVVRLASGGARAGNCSPPIRQATEPLTPMPSRPNERPPFNRLS